MMVKTVKAAKRSGSIAEYVHVGVQALLDGEPCDPAIVQFLSARQIVCNAQWRAEHALRKMCDRAGMRYEDE